jgi:hypothetical protein
MLQWFLQNKTPIVQKFFFMFFFYLKVRLNKLFWFSKNTFISTLAKIYKSLIEIKSSNSSVSEFGVISFYINYL